MKKNEEQTASENMDRKIVVCLSRDRTPFSYVTYLADGGGLTHASLGLSEEAEYYYSFNFKGLKKEYRESLKRRPREMQRYIVAVCEDAYRKLKPCPLCAAPAKFYCSQFVAAVLKESGCVDIRKAPVDCTPNDLRKELEDSGQIVAVEEESEMVNPGEAVIEKAMDRMEKGRDLAEKYVDERLGTLMDKALDKVGTARDLVADAPEELAKLTGGLLRRTRELYDPDPDPEEDTT